MSEAQFSIGIFDFYKSEALDEGKVWICKNEKSSAEGEGMEVDEAELEAWIKEYYEQNF